MTRFCGAKNDSRSISSNLATTIIVGIFVGLVIVGMLVAYIFPPSGSAQNSGGFQGISLSEIILYSGPGSVNSYNQTCNVNEAQLQVYATNNSTANITLTNETFWGGSLGHNATGLVPVSNGCLPISQSGASIGPGVDDLVIESYPSTNLQLATSCYVDVQFSNGQNFTQLLVAQAE